MPNKCIVNGCRSGYKTPNERVSLFHVPKDDALRAKWVQAIPTTMIKPPLKITDVVCEKHFRENDIVRRYIHKDANGTIIANVLYQHPRLATAAVPCISSESTVTVGMDHNYFRLGKSNGLSNGQKNEKPTDDVVIEENWNDPNETIADPVEAQCDESASSIDLHSTLRVHRPENPPLEYQLEGSELMLGKVAASQSASGTCSIVTTSIGQIETIPIPTGERSVVPEADAKRRKFFEELFSTNNLVQLPAGWFRYTSTRIIKWIAFSEFGSKTANDIVTPLPRKTLILTEDLTIHVSVHGKALDPMQYSLQKDHLESSEQLNVILRQLARMGICRGTVLNEDISLVRNDTLYQDGFDQWRHANCPILCPKKQCDSCRRVKKCIAQKKLRNAKRTERKRMNFSAGDTKENIELLRKKISGQNTMIRRLKKRVEVLTKSAQEMAARDTDTGEETIMRKCSELKIPEAQQSCIKEMISAAGKKNSKGRRYNKDWVMLCIMLHIRSPQHYQFLRKNGVLPLPSSRTVRRYLSEVNGKNGSDTEFSELFRNHFATNSDTSINIDHSSEVAIHETIPACSNELIYEGLSDSDHSDADGNIENQEIPEAQFLELIS